MLLYFILLFDIFRISSCFRRPRWRLGNKELSQLWKWADQNPVCYFLLSLIIYLKAKKKKTSYINIFCNPSLMKWLVEYGIGVWNKKNHVTDNNSVSSVCLGCSSKNKRHPINFIKFWQLESSQYINKFFAETTWNNGIPSAD